MRSPADEPTPFTSETVDLVVLGPGGSGALAGAHETAARLRQEMAMRDGALVPLLVAQDTHTYPLFRLVAERTLTINTAAAGGNTSLMTLSA